MLKWIETKIAAATLIPVTHGEAYNVLRCGARPSTCLCRCDRALIVGLFATYDVCSHQSIAPINLSVSAFGLIALIISWLAVLVPLVFTTVCLLSIAWMQYMARWHLSERTDANRTFVFHRRYVNHQHYDSHMDTFDPKDFGPQPSQVRPVHTLSRNSSRS